MHGDQAGNVQEDAASGESLKGKGMLHVELPPFEYPVIFQVAILINCHCEVANS